MTSKPPPGAAGFRLPPPPAAKKVGATAPPPTPPKKLDGSSSSPRVVPSPEPSSPKAATPPPIPQKKAPPPLPSKPGGGASSSSPALPRKPPLASSSSSSSSSAAVSATSLPLPTPPIKATELPLPKPPVDATALPLPTPPEDDEPQDPETLKRIAFEKRRKIVGEILSTEEAYVKALDYMVNAYMHPLEQMAETELLPTRSKAEVRKIFSNVEQLLPINKHLKTAIEERVNNWHENQLIGDIFLKMAQFFKMYNTYGNNYDEASEMLDKCQADPRFSEIEEGIASGTELVSLKSMLIMPVQRIPRYNLLLSDLLRKTEPDHPDHNNIAQALHSFEDVMQYLDSNITKAENVKKFMAMTKIKGGDRIIQAHRVLIADGTLNLKSKKQGDGKGTIKGIIKTKVKEAKLQIWLFNDVMVHLKKSISKKRDISSTEYTWPLELIWIKDNKDQDLQDPKMPFSFILVGPGKTYTVRFPTLEEKVHWMNTIKSAVSKVLNDENAPDDLHRYGHYKFPKEQGEYEGWWKFGRIHGDGVFSFFGNKYSGEWEYNCKSGNGTFELVTGEVYQGEWKEDKPNGYGTLNYTNGDKYEGEWREGARCGKGVLAYANGDRFDGEWRDDVPWGEGVYTTTTGFVYNGGWNGGKLSGYGCLIAPNGRRFEGQFVLGQKVGEGKIDFANGDFFIGQWKEDKPNGFGVYHSAVEGLYEGMFHNGLREGQGKMLFKNGDRYDGQWKRGLFNGNGTLVSASGAIDRYEGQWENGKHNGKGILFYRSGARYEGQFKDDVAHGNGIYISANAVVFDGKWESGRREGKAVISIGPNKHSHSVHGNMMSEGEKSFMIVPDVPAIHLEL